MSAALSVCVATYSFAAAAAPPSNDASQPLQEVTIIGKVDARTVNQEVRQFVRSHAKPGAHIGQVGRWREAVCPTVAGLQGAADELVSHRITAISRAVGAPTRAFGKKCSVNVEVVFTLSPQGLLDHIAKQYRPLLGYFSAANGRQALSFTRPVQAWYVTGTRSLDYLAPAGSFMPANLPKGGQPSNDFLTEMYTPGLNVDSYQFADSRAGVGSSGTAGSYLGKGQRSEFVHVQIIVDSNSVAKYSLQAVSDYIAMLALTRLVSADDCSALPSIVNLFATGCTAVPATITTADIAYLKGLYGADLDKNLNIEQGDIHERMLREVLGR
ncbi:MAG TPA: hypothetical protein VGM97_02445 [Steroidobacteraceae bacterium]|jgi:hypothetical protein